MNEKYINPFDSSSGSYYDPHHAPLNRGQEATQGEQYYFQQGQRELQRQQDHYTQPRPPTTPPPREQEHGDDRSNAGSFASYSSTAALYAPHVNTLARFIMNRDYPNAINFVQRDPDSARIRIIAHEFMGAFRTSQILPLHLALSQGDVPMELILALLNIYPEGILKTETGYRRNCLHIALKAYASDAIISYLIQQYPEACSQQDKLGRLPLHYAISNNHDISIIREILYVYPAAVKSWDNMGWGPLHVACQTFSSKELIELLLSLYPEAVLMVTQKGSTPRDVALSSEQNHKEELLPLLEKVESEFQKHPLIQNYRNAAARDIYHHGHYIPPICHYID